MDWHNVTLADLFKARPEGPYNEIKLYPRKNCPVCGAPLRKLNFKGEDHNLLTANKPVNLLNSIHPKVVEVDCPNCGPNTVKMTK